ncbi:hypothetical protein BgiBS90_002588, partial [Biomphalaria glabrata]
LYIGAKKSPDVHSISSTLEPRKVQMIIPLALHWSQEKFQMFIPLALLQELKRL